MMEVAELDAAGTLDAVDRAYTARVEAETASFLLVAHFADLHAGDALPVPGPSAVGIERSVRVGGPGTPRVAEFAVAELAGRLRMGTWAARRLMADVLDVRHRLPSCWARVVAGQARVGYVRLVAARTRELSVEAAARVDAGMAPFVDGSLPWGRFESRLAGRVVAADPDAAAAREAERLAEQFAKRTRASEHGTAGFYVRSSAGVIARVEATVAFVADALRAFEEPDQPDGEDVRRVKALLVLCNPARAVELLAAYAALRSRSLAGQPSEADDGPPCGEGPDRRRQDELPITDVPDSVPELAPDPLARMDAFARRVGFTPTRLPEWLSARTDQEAPRFEFDWSGLLPPVRLLVHVAADDLASQGRGGGGVARWEGVGPVTHQFVREHLGPVHRFLVTPVVDLPGMAPVDAYEVPDRHRRAVRLRTPTDCFPYSSDLSERLDTDHTTPYLRAVGPDGAGDMAAGLSEMANYGPLGRFHHRVKTFGRWVVRQPFEGVYLWRDPHGQLYLVDHTGSHKLTAPGTAVGRPTRHDAALEVRVGGTVVELDAGSTG